MTRDSSPVWCELVCGCCSETTAGQFTYGAIPRADMRADAKLYGWVFRDGDWLCRKCKSNPPDEATA